MKYTGTLISGDFEDNTMTFEIQDPQMILQAGEYTITRNDGESLVTDEVLSGVTTRNWFERMPLYARYLWYMVGGIFIGLLLPYVW